MVLKVSKSRVNHTLQANVGRLPDVTDPLRLTGFAVSACLEPVSAMGSAGRVLD